MVIETLQKIFKRDLEKLKQEIASYRDENNLWVVDKSITNSSGNLCLHLVGNLNAYIGAEIGKTGYVRNRDLEFSQKNIPLVQLVKMIVKESILYWYLRKKHQRDIFLFTWLFIWVIILAR